MLWDESHWEFLWRKRFVVHSAGPWSPCAWCISIQSCEVRYLCVFTIASTFKLLTWPFFDRVFTVFSTSKDHGQGKGAMAGCILVDSDRIQVLCVVLSINLLILITKYLYLGDQSFASIQRKVCTPPSVHGGRFERRAGSVLLVKSTTYIRIIFVCIRSSNYPKWVCVRRIPLSTVFTQLERLQPSLKAQRKSNFTSGGHMTSKIRSFRSSSYFFLLRNRRLCGACI